MYKCNIFFSNLNPSFYSSLSNYYKKKKIFFYPVNFFDLPPVFLPMHSNLQNTRHDERAVYELH